MNHRGIRSAVAALSGLVAFALVTVAVTESAQAAVTVSRAEVSGTKLRIEGSAAAQRPITVDGVTMATSSTSGTFKVDRSGYTRPADCTVDIGDGTGAPLNVRLSGCTPTTPTTAPPPSSVTLQSVTVNSSSIQGGATVGATVTLSGAAPVGGVSDCNFLSAYADPAAGCLATGLFRGGVTVVDLRGADSRVVFPADKNRTLHAVALSPTGDRVAVVSCDSPDTGPWGYYLNLAATADGRSLWRVPIPRRDVNQF